MSETREPDWNAAEHHDVEDRFVQMAEMRGRCPVAFDDRNGGVWDILRYEDVPRGPDELVPFGKIWPHVHVFPFHYPHPVTGKEFEAPEE